MSKKTLVEYAKAVDADVRKFVEDVINDNAQLSYITVAFLSEEASSKIKELTGKETKGNRVVLDANAVRHIEKRHGLGGEHDQSMKSIDDLARIGFVVDNYDEIVYEGKISSGYSDENGNPSPLITIKKRINGTYYVVEAVNSAKGCRNYIISAFIKKA